jgi:hypothetical protein
MKMILDDNGIRYLELEFLTDWFLDGTRKIVHVITCGSTYEEVSRIPLRHIVNVELNDGALPGSPRFRGDSRRPPPGAARPRSPAPGHGPMRR